MAYIEVWKGEKLIIRRVVNEQMATKGCRVRLGSKGRVRIRPGESKSVGAYRVDFVTGQTSVPSKEMAEGPAEPVTADWPSKLDFSLPGHKARMQEEQAAPQIEGYRILEQLGYGGMGTVWRTVQLSTKRQVALKLLGTHSFISEKAKARFEREVALAAKLTHPNIARIYDSGLRSGIYYYAMELVEGKHLEKYVFEEKLDQRQVLILIKKICKTMAFAHREGVIHRDLKPSNILVSKDGEPHILDFGLAKTVEKDLEDLTISIDGEVAGTPGYMAPEQAAGRVETANKSWDVYSLGVILYQLLTRKMPHDMSGSPYDVFKRKVEQDVIPPRKAEPSIDRDLESLLLKALARQSKDRYVSIEDFTADIENYLLDKPLAAALKTTRHEINAEVIAPELVETKKTSTSQNLGIIAGAVTVMVIVGVFIVWLSLRNSNPGTRNPTRIPPRQRVANPIQKVASQKETFERYEDTKYCFFSCLYPSGWTVNELDDAKNRRVQFLGREAEIRIRITKAQGNEFQGSELTKLTKSKSRELFPKEKGTFISERSLNVAGIQAYEMQYRQNQPRAHCRAVMLYANRRMHVLMFAVPSESLFNKWSGRFDRFLESYLEWRAYTDPKGRFVCKVPPGWIIREDSMDPRSKVSFSCKDGEIGIITRDTGRHILEESDREEFVSVMQNVVQQAQQARLISVEWTSIAGIKGLKSEIESIEPERFRAKQMKFKRDGWDHCITLTVRSPDQQKDLEILFDQFLQEYKNQSG